ncbi:MULTISPECIES: DUF397 domain-containing protein [unclassified Streptomyces]|uniref:DUF397 domain-containing protein n=1 Tax=unclassified Streptomyces TaxID=2593676 RepID=UPI00094019DC|nr:DUF397 domain-containing protein [Streptomyces sp. TSRI0281]OKI38466.1 hypothetical protein A6A29_10975 [Streptomyces sp. TSRI0281]
MVPAIPSDETLTWFKSSYSGGNTTECVETAYLARGAAVRDSKHVDGPRLRFGSAAWQRFVDAVHDRTAAIPATVRRP